MVSPASKRRAVEHVKEKLSVSERRACRVIGQSRTSQRYESKTAKKDQELTKAMRKIIKQRPRYGCRRVYQELRAQGLEVNYKRVHRIWKKEGLQIKRRSKRKRKTGAGGKDLRATQVNEIWSYDFMFDETSDGKGLKWLNVIDEYSRESLVLTVGRRMRSKEVIEALKPVVRKRGAPKILRSDNGPEFVSREVVEWVKEEGFKTEYIMPGAPWQNGYIESFNARMRDELLNVEEFGSVEEAKVLGKAYQKDYNENRRHSSLGYQTPSEFATNCFASLRATPCATQSSSS